MKHTCTRARVSMATIDLLCTTSFESFSVISKWHFSCDAPVFPLITIQYGFSSQQGCRFSTLARRDCPHRRHKRIDSMIISWSTATAQLVVIQRWYANRRWFFLVPSIVSIAGAHRWIPIASNQPSPRRYQRGKTDRDLTDLNRLDKST